MPEASRGPGAVPGASAPSFSVGGRRLTLTGRVCSWLLGAAMLAAAGLILWLNRETTFSLDQVDFVEDSPGLGPLDLLDPHNGHLVATTRLAYKAILETVGIEYLSFRLLGVLALLLAAGAFYALARRMVGDLPALAATVVLLFFGSAWDHVVVPIGFTNLFSIAAGLGALLAVERRDRPGDVAACLLAILSVASFSTGTAFVVGIAVLVLLEDDRRRRAWVFLVPIAVYAAWWVYALRFDQPAEPETKLSNLLLIPSYVAQSLALVLGGLSGLAYDFADPLQRRDPGWGPVLAILAGLALAIRIGRGGVPRALWAFLAVILAYWGALALTVEPVVRPPGAPRYMFMGAVGVLLVAAAAVAPLRLSGRGLLTLLAVAGVSLATNLALLRDGAAQFREDYSARAQAQFTALDLARGRVDPAFDPLARAADVSPVSSPAGIYYEAVDRYGSPAFTPGELRAQSETVRRTADRILVAALELGLDPPPPRTVSGCRRVAPDTPESPLTLPVPEGGALIRPLDAVASVSAGRFAEAPSVTLGELPAGAAATFKPPPDGSPADWHLAVAGADSVLVCPLSPDAT